MTVPVELSIVDDIPLERHLEIERAVQVQHVDTKKFAEEQAREQETVYHHERLSEQHRC